MVIADPKQVLKQYFGYDNFRPMQREIVEQALGGKDVLVLMPTGGGKSLCYQVPAICLPGLSLVVSPLIALMQDQVNALRANGVAAAFINSTQSRSEQVEIEQACNRGEIKLLYVSPEKLTSEHFSYWLKELQVSMIAVDEAHCISFWGHDFRPEYTRLGFLRKLLPKVPLMALTATADKLTRKDIVKQLHLRKPAVFISSFDRENLSLKVQPAQKRLQQILTFLEARPFEPGIIYCLSRKGCEQLADKLNKAGYNAAPYHAALPLGERAKTQEDFLRDNVQVVCATIAFGMGIDKSNVRWVIHYNLPKNIESYYQEIGRAGRDSERADTLLFYSLADVIKQRGMLEELPDDRRRLQEAKLERLQQYAEANICRRKVLLAYFGEVLEQDCGNCDVCANPRQQINGTVLAQKALSAVVRAKESLGVSLLVDVLRGADTDEIRRRSLYQLKTYGAGSDVHPLDWRQYIQQFINLGLLEIAYDSHQHLKVSASGQAVLFDGKEVQLYKLEQRSKEQLRPQPKPSDQADEMLFQSLRELRKKLADEQGVPPYIIFSDKSLREMASEKPRTPEQLSAISGVGKQKLALYGDDFVGAIEKYFGQQKEKASRQAALAHQLTLRMLKEGASPEEVAQKRKMQLVTVYSHIAALYEQRELSSVAEYLPEVVLQAVGDALYVLGKEAEVKEIDAYLKQRYPKHFLRLCKVYWLRRGL